MYSDENILQNNVEVEDLTCIRLAHKCESIHWEDNIILFFELISQNNIILWIDKPK